MTCEDLFSADLSDDELRQQLQRLWRTCPSLWVFSAEDEYVPKESVDQVQLGLRLQSLSETMPSPPAIRHIPQANHNLSSSSVHQEHFLDMLLEFISDTT